MLRFFAFSLVYSCFVLNTQAQIASPRHITVLDLTGAAGPNLNYASAAAWRLWNIDRRERFKAGLGARTSYSWGPTAAFDNQNDDVQPALLLVPQPRLLALNLALHLRAWVVGPVGVGFNLDFLGASFGTERTAEFSPNASLSVAARPVQFNLLQGGLSDRGSLNSEFYLRLALPRRLNAREQAALDNTAGVIIPVPSWSIRVGWSHIVTAYAVDDTRYRRFWNLAALGVSYKLR